MITASSASQQYAKIPFVIQIAHQVKLWATTNFFASVTMTSNAGLVYVRATAVQQVAVVTMNVIVIRITIANLAHALIKNAHYLV